MLENEFSMLIVGNGVGVGFGWLMYRMATTAIKENTQAINELRLELRARRRENEDLRNGS